MDERRLGIPKLTCHIASEAKVGVLIHSAGYETGNLGCLDLVGAKEEGEGRRKGRCCLDSGEVNLMVVN
jgi:hypothetical protein